MIKVGITGGIGSGKSTCAMHLMFQGYEIYSADSINHELLKTTAKDKIFEEFGPSVFDVEGNVSRRALASVVFNNEVELKKLNSIMHPLVIDRIKEIINTSDKEIIFFDIPLLFETGMEDLFDATINVYTSTEEQVKRIMARDNSTKEEALARINAQMLTSEKNQKATFILEANDIDKMYADLDDIVRRILNHEI